MLRPMRTDNEVGPGNGQTSPLGRDYGEVLWQVGELVRKILLGTLVAGAADPDALANPEVLAWFAR